MKNQYIYSALILTALLCAGCAKEIENPTDSSDSAAIELSSVSTDPMTRAVITGTSFTTDEAAAGIGLFLLDGTGATYGSNTPNVKYTFSSSKWTAASPLRVGGTAGTLYGYYPYSSTVTDITAIPVASSVNGTDYLFGSIANLTSANAKTESLTLSHALARVSLSFRLDGSYEGDGALSSISLSGDCVAANGTLNAKTGSINATAGMFSADGLDRTVTKSAFTTVECLVVPVANESGTPELRIACTIDGKAYATTFTGDLAALAQGRQTTIELTVKNTSITLDGSSIGAWGDGGSQTVTVGGDYAVTIKLDESDNIIVDDVLMSVKVDGNTVKILAISLSEDFLKCTLTGVAVVSRSRSDNIFTFTISDIGSDVTATIGYDTPFTITTLSNNSTWGTASFEGECYYGETITFRATQKSGIFIEWQDADGKKLDWENPQSITLTSDITVKAVFNFSSFLPGKFTVNAQGKKVRFSRGNLWYGDHRNVETKIPEGFYIEEAQYRGEPSSRDSLWNTSHICHFFWGGNVEYSRHEQYAYWSPTVNDVLFTNKTETTPNPNFTVFEDGLEQKGMWRTLSDSEWQYILYEREMTYNKPRYTSIIQRIRIESGLYAGMFIYPDDYNSEEVGEQFTWQEINDAGIVFLPSIGYRDKYNVYGIKNLLGGYWSSTTVESDVNAARCVFINERGEPYISDEKRNIAHCIRLVYDYN